MLDDAGLPTCMRMMHWADLPVPCAFRDFSFRRHQRCSRRPAGRKVRLELATLSEASNKRLLPEGPSPEPSFWPSVRTGRSLLSMRVPARLRHRRLRSPWWRRAPRIARKLCLAIGLQGAVLADPNAVLAGTFEAMLLIARRTHQDGGIRHRDCVQWGCSAICPAICRRPVLLLPGECSFNVMLSRSSPLPEGTVDRLAL
jgi:hypothetical protein